MVKNKFLNYSLFFVLIITCIFIGYEYPSIIETPKKIVKFLLKKVKITDSFIVEKKELKEVDKDKIIKVENNINIDGNSFNLSYSKIINFDGKTAGLFIKDISNEKQKFDIFLQNGIKISNDKVEEINLPFDIFLEKNGGVKSIIQYNSKYFALVSNKKNINCYYSSIVNLVDAKKIFFTNCLPDIEKIDFNGIGGAYVEKDGNIYLSIGAPEWDSEQIRMLAQDNLSKYGKILVFKKDSFRNDKILESDFEIFTKGHKNPQGIVESNDNIFSVEHGPQGGDEINLIKKGKNYGWPVVSFGTRYNDGKGYKKGFNKMESPLFSFIPSIAPSTINKCPGNLQRYYSNQFCFLILSLRAMSVYVTLIDKEKLNIISVERFKIDQRLRHFALNEKNKMFVKNDYFYISADDFGVLKMKFDDFR